MIHPTIGNSVHQTRSRTHARTHTHIRTHAHTHARTHERTHECTHTRTNTLFCFLDPIKDQTTTVTKLRWHADVVTSCRRSCLACILPPWWAFVVLGNLQGSCRELLRHFQCRFGSQISSESFQQVHILSTPKCTSGGVHVPCIYTHTRWEVPVP